MTQFFLEKKNKQKYINIKSLKLSLFAYIINSNTYPMNKVFALLLATYIPAHLAMARELEEERGFTNREAWAIGFPLAVLVSSLGFVMALAMIPIMKSKKISAKSLNNFIHVLLALAGSSITANAFVSLVPEAFMIPDKDASIEDL